MAGSKTILCIEDDHFISELYARALRKAGYEVEIVMSGKEGLEKAIANHYDIILLDIMTPDLTGVEVLEFLRGKGDKIPDSYIVITTNLDQDDETRATVEKMADGYLIKAEITPTILVDILGKLA